MTRTVPILCLAALLATPALAAQRVELILDGSGSMWGEAGGETKIVAAKRTLQGLVETIALPADAALGLTVYGHRSKGDCGDIEHFPAVAYADRARLLPLIDGIQPKGKTPIADSLAIVGEALRGSEDEASIVLVSDGVESCDKDPCEVARRLRHELGIEVVIHVVGFDVREGSEQLACIAEKGGGLFVTADSAAQLETALARVEQVVAAPAAEPESEPINVAAAANGGRVILASSHYSHWHQDRLLDGRPEEWASDGAGPQSVVIGFADDRRARIVDLIVNPYSTMDTGRWAREVMVFGSEVSPWEGFELWGMLALEPVGSEQVLTFEPPVTARYVKLNFMANHGGSSHIAASEVMLMGRLLDDDPPAGPSPTNLAAAEAGATIKATSHYSSWRAENLIDGTHEFWASDGANPQDVTIRLAGDGPRSLSLVAVNPHTVMNVERWAREIEVATSVSSPYKGFVPQGRLELQPVGEYQVLRFAEPVTARYLRLRFLTNHGDRSHISASEVVALGE